MSQPDSLLHVRGESKFCADLPSIVNTLHAAVFTAPFACGRIRLLEIAKALQIEEVFAVLTAQDIVGQNQIGNIIPDEPLLAADEFDYCGQPLALIIARSASSARRAIKAIHLEYDPIEPIFDPRQAYAQNQLIIPPRIFQLGDPDSAWKECDFIFSGRVDSPAQEHLYLETQNAYALPLDHGGLKVYSATQSPTAVQRTIARVLNLPMNKIEVEVPRLGGGFGGKEDQATAWAAMAALGAFLLKKPVRIHLSRIEDLAFTGKRHPYSSDYKIGLKKDGRIIAYEVTFYQNSGAASDLSPAVLERSLFHATNCYFIPNVKITGYCCRTNLPPFTAFRGFGAPQAILVIESAIDQAATSLNIPAERIKCKNLLKKNSLLPYGMKVREGNARRCWKQLQSDFEIQKIRQEISSFNRQHRLYKKGMAIVPVCFGISFTTRALNQASALVHIYTDGSISISTAAVEMGQGVNSKLIRIASSLLGISPQRIKIETTSTTRNANTSPTAASTGADLNGQALIIAIQSILQRLKSFLAKKFNLKRPELLAINNERFYYQQELLSISWSELIQQAYLERINLSAHAHYATPGLSFNRHTNRGTPFAYHVFGTALITVCLDLLRGTYQLEKVRIVHDCGQALDPLIDRGQIEGALLQGLGWLTLEEVFYDSSGRLISNSLSTYKVPDIFFSPDDVQISFLRESSNSRGPLNSKAVGEPPLIYGIGGYFALLNAIRAIKTGFIPEHQGSLSPERVLTLLEK